MFDPATLAPVSATLEADGFHLDARSAPDGTLMVTVTADAGTCGDCLVPKDVLRQILRRALDLPDLAIDLTYPSDTTTSGSYR
ncbi:hypothetical protein [Streptomyces sp. NPDC055400]